jgi:hypothetical protein
LGSPSLYVLKIGMKEREEEMETHGGEIICSYRF